MRGSSGGVFVFSSPLSLHFFLLSLTQGLHFSFSGFVSILRLLAAGRFSPSPLLGLEGWRRIASLLLEAVCSSVSTETHGVKLEFPACISRSPQLLFYVVLQGTNTAAPKHHDSQSRASWMPGGWIMGMNTGLELPFP